MTDANSPAVNERSAPERSAPERSAPERSAPERLVLAVDRLVGQVAHWQPGRWSMPGGGSTGVAGAGPGGQPSRADRVHALVQRLADLGADTEQRPRAPVPRLGDLVLPDQLRVVADDLLGTGDAPGLAPQAIGAGDRVISAAADDVDAVRRTL